MAMKTSPTHANCTLSRAQKCNNSPSVLASMALAVLYHFSSLTRICLFLSQMHISFFCVQVLCPRSLANSAYEWQTIVSLSLQTHVWIPTFWDSGKGRKISKHANRCLLPPTLASWCWDPGNFIWLRGIRNSHPTQISACQLADGQICIPQLRAPSFSLSHHPYLKGKKHC